MLISLLRTNLRWILIAILLLPQLSYAATIGNVVLQEGVTSVEREGAESDLDLDSDIMFMDNVKTGKGELGITFIDDTNVAVSSQSSLIIDDFVYDPNKEFENYVNPSSVVWLKPETKYWIEYLNGLINEHYKETESNTSKKILKNFDIELKHFQQVCPKEMLNKLMNPISLKTKIFKAV